MPDQTCDQTDQVEPILHTHQINPESLLNKVLFLFEKHVCLIYCADKTAWSYYV